jgi:hypothetical protein
MERSSDPVPTEPRRIRAELGVNPTPGAAEDPGLHDDTVDALAPGIRDYLGE